MVDIGKRLVVGPDRNPNQRLHLMRLMLRLAPR
jgi:hypothetical protein